MTNDARRRVALLFPGDRKARQNAAPENSRFLKVFPAKVGKNLIYFENKQMK